MAESNNGGRRDKGLATLNFGLTVLALAVGVVVAYFTARSDLETRVALLEAAHSRDIQQLQNEVGKLQGSLGSHHRSGIDGVAHPVGAQVAIDDLRKRVRQLEKN